LAHDAAEKGTPLTAEFLDATYRGLVARYYGPDLTIDPNDATEWATSRTSFYKYYVYAYATGMSSAVVLAENVRSGDPKKRDAYLGMLAAGSSKPPLDILRDAGVDLTRPDAVVAAARLMDRTIKEMPGHPREEGWPLTSRPTREKKGRSRCAPSGKDSGRRWSPRYSRRRSS